MSLQVGAKMKGLFTDPVTELVCFIKKVGHLRYIKKILIVIE